MIILTGILGFIIGVLASCIVGDLLGLGAWLENNLGVAKYKIIKYQTDRLRIVQYKPKYWPWYISKKSYAGDHAQRRAIEYVEYNVKEDRRYRPTVTIIQDV